jgi:hypothetical protein
MTAAQQRLGIALVKSALAVPVICAIGYAFIDMGEKHDPGAHVAAIIIASAAIFVIGLPIALTLGAALAIMFGERLQKGVVSVRIATVVFATVIGTIGVPVAWRYFGEADSHSIMVITGAIAGFVSGCVFCYLADERPVDGSNPISTAT